MTDRTIAALYIVNKILDHRISLRRILFVWAMWGGWIVHYRILVGSETLQSGSEFCLYC